MILPDGTVLNIRHATGFVDRLRGLLFQPPLVGQQGLLIEPCNSVHGFTMRYSIDAVFLDDSWRIVKVSQLNPWGVAGCRSATRVLELPAGLAGQYGLVVGVRLQI